MSLGDSMTPNHNNHQSNQTHCRFRCVALSISYGPLYFHCEQCLPLINIRIILLAVRSTVWVHSFTSIMTVVFKIRSRRASCICRLVSRVKRITSSFPAREFRKFNRHVSKAECSILESGSVPRERLGNVQEKRPTPSCLSARSVCILCV